MSDKFESEIATLRTTYAAFNARDIDAALATMTADLHAGHLFTFEQGLISKMEISELPVATSG